MAADAAAASLKDSGLAKHEAIGVLAVDAKGKLKEDKVVARSTKKGAGVGAVLRLLGPVGIGAGVVGGGLLGALHHKGLGWMTMTRRPSARSSLAGMNRRGRRRDRRR